SDPCGTNPGFAAGVIGQALSLDGVDDHLVVDVNVGIDGNTPRTICCWAKSDSMVITNWTLIFGFTTVGGGNDSHFNIGVSTAILQAEPSFIAHVWGWEEQILPLDVDVWHHLAMTYDGSTIRYYGDGVELDTDLDKSQVRNLIHADNVQIGKRATQASSFPGAVDDARIYSVVLSEAEIAYLATQGK
ncbi:MAG: LamG domain-containing protein, partial [Planctomycetota bacterium]